MIIKLCIGVLKIIPEWIKLGSEGSCYTAQLTSPCWVGIIKLAEQVLLCCLRRLHPLSQSALRCAGEAEQGLSLLLCFPSAEGVGIASPSPEWASNGDHPKCVIYEFSSFLKCCRTFPCVPSASEDSENPQRQFRLSLVKVVLKFLF